MKIETRHLEKEGADALAARLAEGDPLAPRDLVRRHYAELFRYAFSMLRDDGAAEDAVHDAFERAFRALGGYPEERLRAMMLRPWLYRITLNVVRNRVKLRKETPFADVDAVLADKRGTEVDESREASMDALDALEKLPERQRVTLTLRYVQDLRYADIASATGWPENTVKTLVRRGLARLRKTLERGETP